MFRFGKKKKVKVEPEVHLIPPLDTPAVIVDDAGETVSPDRIRTARVEYYSAGMIFAYGHHTGLAGAIVERDWTAIGLEESRSPLRRKRPWDKKGLIGGLGPPQRQQVSPDRPHR